MNHISHHNKIKQIKLAGLKTKIIDWIFKVQQYEKNIKIALKHKDSILLVPAKMEYAHYSQSLHLTKAKTNKIFKSNYSRTLKS